MRDATTNPFEPGADRVPRVWAGRDAQLADWRDRVRPRRAQGLGERGRTLLGEPGIGKSVLVRRIATTALQAGDWVTPQIRLPVGVDPLRTLAEEVAALADRVGLAAGRERRVEQLVGRVRSIGAGPVGVDVAAPTGRERYREVRDLTIELGRAARADGRVVLLHLDEVQNVTDDEQMSQLLVTLGDVLGHEEELRVPGAHVTAALPIAVYLTGLPEFADRADSRHGATFSRRFMTTVLGPLDDDELLASLQPLVVDGVEVGDGERVRLTTAAAAAVTTCCLGDPFLFQVAGQHAWDVSRDPLVTAEHVEQGWLMARTEARRHVERQLARLPAKERALLDAMASLDPAERRATAIAEAMGYSSAPAIGTAAQRLDTVRGIIDRGARYGFRLRTVEALLGGDWP